jgi:hypothetical protein
MPRKALAPAHAALRFAQQATNECGPGQAPDEAERGPHESELTARVIASAFTTCPSRWDVMGRDSFAGHGNCHHKSDTGNLWTNHARMVSN